MGPAGAVTPAPAFRVLVFSDTQGFRHDSIPAAISAVDQLGQENGFAVDATESPSVFADSTLSRYAVVMFLLTTGNVLDQGEQAAFTRYIERGGAFVGVHSAADTEHDWPWYGSLVGAYFFSHPAVQTATVDVVDRDTPSTIHLPAHWVRSDEWYNFQPPPSASVTVLARLDETTYQPGDGAMGSSHPIAWQQVFDGGRSWYTAGGHTAESYSDPLFREHLLGGILWAAGYDLPTFRSVTTKLTANRLHVVATHSKCYRCTLRLQIWTGARSRTIVVDAGGTGTAATTRPLGRGRHRYSIVLTDQPLRARATRRGTIVVG